MLSSLGQWKKFVYQAGKRVLLKFQFRERRTSSGLNREVQFYKFNFCFSSVCENRQKLQ